ncbi:glycoside hydrolase family 5 protein [Labrys portucalensis]|uniref:Glycoside hydrolase family 5 protein n=1 Tax=Labrys neptuniae TaxID=376174 RepID=A0ABV6ZQE3_9HYPH
MKNRFDGKAPSIDRRCALGTLAGLALTASMPASRASDPKPRGPDLSRGINLSHWFAQSQEGYGADHLTRFITRPDIARLAAAGFTHVRLGFEPDAVFAQSGKPALDETVSAHLNEAIAMIASQKLGIVLDMHPVGASKERYLKSEGAERLVANWRLLARRLVSVPQDQLAFDILNEPEPLKGEAWWSLQERLVKAIRGVDPTRALIVNAGGWSGADDLVLLTPYRYDGLIYTIHHYGPLLFTHQGTDWTWQVAERVHGLTWPIAPDLADRASATAVSSPSDRAILRDQITKGQFTEAFLLAPFEQLAAWSSRHGKLPIYVGEFGVYRNAPHDARLRWLAASRQAFADRGWGWAHWDNSAAFGLVSADTGQFDRATLRAFGMLPA